jgi:hypothetical protein
MKLEEILGGAPFFAFGLWWLLAPRSVIRFYARFHKSHNIVLPKESAVRVAGALWLALLIVLLSFARSGK